MKFLMSLAVLAVVSATSFAQCHTVGAGFGVGAGYSGGVSANFAAPSACYAVPTQSFAAPVMVAPTYYAKPAFNSFGAVGYANSFRGGFRGADYGYAAPVAVAPVVIVNQGQRRRGGFGSGGGGGGGFGFNLSASLGFGIGR